MKQIQLYIFLLLRWQVLLMHRYIGAPDRGKQSDLSVISIGLHSLSGKHASTVANVNLLICRDKASPGIHLKGAGHERPGRWSVVLLDNFNITFQVQQIGIGVVDTVVGGYIPGRAINLIKNDVRGLQDGIIVARVMPGFRTGHHYFDFAGFAENDVLAILDIGIYFAIFGRDIVGRYVGTGVVVPDNISGNDNGHDS
jgi:hypothetical protein